MTDATGTRVHGGSSSPLTPGAGDATQAAKDGEPGAPSDSRPPHESPFTDSVMQEIMMPEPIIYTWVVVTGLVFLGVAILASLLVAYWRLV
jgi:hypothetical protein